MTKAATIVREFYDALARGDVPAVLSLLDENIAWTEAESFPYYRAPGTDRRRSSKIC